MKCDLGIEGWGGIWTDGNHNLFSDTIQHCYVTIYY